MQVNADLWDFPHAMMFKIMGKSEHNLAGIVLTELSQLGIEHEASSCKEKLSAKGTFSSVSVNIVVKTKTEVEALYANMSAKPEVKMIL